MYSYCQIALAIARAITGHSRTSMGTDYCPNCTRKCVINYTNSWICGSFLYNSAKGEKCNLVGVVLVHMRDMHYALFVGASGLQIIPSICCATVRARFPTVSSHPIELKDTKHSITV